MKSFKEFLNNKKFNESSALDIAKKTLGTVTFTPEEKMELTNLYAVVKDVVSKNPLMFQSFLTRMSKGDLEMERLLSSLDLNALKRASRKQVKGLEYLENSATDVIRGVVGSTSYSGIEENELIDLFTLVLHAMSKNPIMVKSYLDRMTKGEDSQNSVDKIDPSVLRIAARKALSKTVDDESTEESDGVNLEDEV